MVLIHLDRRPDSPLAGMPGHERCAFMARSSPFDNPGKDVNNVKADDVLTPRRQQELEALTAELAKFRSPKQVRRRGA
ncbi:hypothetical protein [Melittangium boletus]|nr:hypothetical protein [Melittangium boletus]